MVNVKDREITARATPSSLPVPKDPIVLSQSVLHSCDNFVLVLNDLAR